MKTWGVVGSRSFNDYSLLKIVLDNNRPDIIVSGGASGTDSMARRYAQENSIKLVEHLPDYDKFGKGAPLLRNKSIVKDSDHVIAFWDGLSSGTRFTIDYAQKQGKSVHIIDTSLKFNRSKILNESSDRISAWSTYLDSLRVVKGSASLLKAAKKSASMISNPEERLQYSYLYTKSVFNPSKYKSLGGKENVYFVMPSSSGNQFPFALAIILKENFGGEIATNYANQVHRGHVKDLFGVNKVVASRSYEVTESLKKSVSSFKNKNIVLVDDLISTGVTVDSLRFELCKAGLKVDYICSLINTSSSLSTQNNISNLAKSVFEGSELNEYQRKMSCVFHNTPGNIVFHLYRGVKGDSDRSVIKNFVDHKYSGYIDYLYKHDFLKMKELYSAADISEHINNKYGVILSPFLISSLDSALVSTSPYKLYSNVNSSILSYLSYGYSWKANDSLSNEALKVYSSSNNDGNKYFVSKDDSGYTAFRNSNGINHFLGKDPSLPLIEKRIEIYAINSHIKSNLQCIIDKQKSFQLSIDI